MKQYIIDLEKTFDVIAVSETWLNDDMNMNDFALDNYSIFNINRPHKRGGGVLLYVLNKHESKIFAEFSKCIDEVIEYVTVEITIPHCKNIFLSCMYRPPGGNIDIFNEYLHDHLQTLEQRNVELCQDKPCRMGTAW